MLVVPASRPMTAMFRGVLPLVAGSIWLTVGLGEASPRRAGGGGGSGEDESKGEAEADGSQPNRVAVPHFAPWLKHDDDAVPAARRRRYSVCLQASPISSAGGAPHFQSGGAGFDSRRILRTPYWPVPSVPVRSPSGARVGLVRGSHSWILCFFLFMQAPPESSGRAADGGRDREARRLQAELFRGFSDFPRALLTRASERLDAATPRLPLPNPRYRAAAAAEGAQRAATERGASGASGGKPLRGAAREPRRNTEQPTTEAPLRAASRPRYGSARRAKARRAKARRAEERRATTRLPVPLLLLIPLTLTLTLPLPLSLTLTLTLTLNLNRTSRQGVPRATADARVRLLRGAKGRRRARLRGHRRTVRARPRPPAPLAPTSGFGSVAPSPRLGSPQSSHTVLAGACP